MTKACTLENLGIAMVMPFFVAPSESSEMAFRSFQLFYQESKVLDETLLKADQADRTHWCLHHDLLPLDSVVDTCG